MIRLKLRKGPITDLYTKRRMERTAQLTQEVGKEAVDRIREKAKRIKNA